MLENVRRVTNKAVILSCCGVMLGLCWRTSLDLTSSLRLCSYVCKPATDML